MPAPPHLAPVPAQCLRARRVPASAIPASRAGGSGRRASGSSAMRIAATLVAAVLPLAVPAAEALTPALEERLAAGGVESVNAYLVANGPSALAPFGQRTAACELAAVSLAVRLTRSGNVQAALAHTEALRHAVGRCTAFVLALATPQEVTRFCASASSWTVGQTVRELNRRMAAIQADELLRTTGNGRACRAAYLHELQTTRVVLRSAPAGARSAASP